VVVLIAAKATVIMIRTAWVISSASQEMGEKMYRAAQGRGNPEMTIVLTVHFKSILLMWGMTDSSLTESVQAPFVWASVRVTVTMILIAKETIIATGYGHSLTIQLQKIMNVLKAY